MNIKIRLSFQFTLIAAAILLFFSVLVYYFSYSSQLVKFRQILLDNAKNTATLLIDVAEVDSSLLRKIQQSTISLQREEFVITDSVFNVIYSNKIDYLSDSEILINSANGDINYFSVDDKDGVFYRHIFEGNLYYVYSIATDGSRSVNLKELRNILFWSILFSIWLSVLFSYFFARRAIRPISRIIKSVKEINSLKLANRLDEGDKKDEIAQLAITFNELLSDLEIAFKNQVDFVSNASHELRTPISVMISESDYILNHENEKEEYAEHIYRMVNDLKKINMLISNLLELAQVSRDRTIVFSKVRIDEIVFNSIYQVKTKYPARKIVPKIVYPENVNTLLIEGNEGLLTIAFRNLIENACKFSEDDVIIEIVFTSKDLSVIISDRGVGIPSDELERIYRPFSRASNVKYISGFGIGLSLVARIMELHDAAIDIQSMINDGTKIVILFRRDAAQI